MLDGTRKPFSRLDGADVSDYFDRYARKHDLLSRCRFNTSVEKIRKNDKGWDVLSRTDETFFCDKLIVSTGLASRPKWPQIPNVDPDFKGPVIHSRYLGTDHHRLTDPSVESVVVLGGCKSAIETAMICIDAGKFVHWIIRPEGTGAGMMIVTDKSRPNIVAVNVTRIFNTLTPSIFNASGFWYDFFHSGKNRLGRKLNKKYWKTASKVVFSGPKYHKSKNGMNVQPSTDSVFWNPNCISIIDSNGPFIEYLHDENKLQVVRAGVTHLSSTGVHLTTGATIAADAVVYATGWEKSPAFFSSEDAIDLGLPGPLSQESVETAKEWKTLDSAAEVYVKATFPALTNPPDFNLPAPCKTPYRLYRNIIPPNFAARDDRSIAFTGMLVTSQTAFYSELSALYAIAYMEDLLPDPLPNAQDMKQDVATVNAWMKARYLNKGVEEPLNLSEQTLFDQMCRELGIKVHRKKGLRWAFGSDLWFWEWFAPYRARDYSGFVDELLEAVASRRTPKASTADGKTIVKCEEVDIDNTEKSESRPICYRMGTCFRKRQLVETKH